MPECTHWLRTMTCANGPDCLYLHVDPAFKKPPCPHYERGFCPLGPHCAARHVKKKNTCPFYLAGFCPNGRECTEGGHPVWREKEELKRPEAKVILSPEEQEAEREKLLAQLEKEEESRDYGSGHRGRGGGRGRGRKGWVDRGRGRDRS